MALAYISEHGSGPESFKFLVDIGTNPYYQYLIKGNNGSEESGLSEREGIFFTSVIKGPIPEFHQGQFTLEVPVEQFSSGFNHVIQLISYKDPNGKGMTSSKPLSVLTGVHGAQSTTKMKAPLTNRVRFSYSEIARGNSIGHHAAQLNRNNLGKISEKQLSYTHVPVVRLTIPLENQSDLAITNRLVFKYRADVRLKFEVQTPKPIRKAVLILMLKILDTEREIWRDSIRLEEVQGGPLKKNFILPAKISNQIIPNQPYMFCAQLLWKGNKDQKLGTMHKQEVLFVRKYLFQRAIPTDRKIPLNDVQTHRDFWHRVWSGTFPGDIRELKLDAKYYFVWEANREKNARMETLIKVDEDDGYTRKGRLKSGLIINPHSLNHLLPHIDKSQPPLSSELLEPLNHPSFSSFVHQVGRAKLSFRGREDDTVTLWAFPHLQFFNIHLREITEFDSNGWAKKSANEPTIIAFPLPVSVHFIGTQLD